MLPYWRSQQVGCKTSKVQKCVFMIQEIWVCSTMAMRPTCAWTLCCEEELKAAKSSWVWKNTTLENCRKAKFSAGQGKKMQSPSGLYTTKVPSYQWCIVYPPPGNRLAAAPHLPRINGKSLVREETVGKISNYIELQISWIKFSSISRTRPLWSWLILNSQDMIKSD